jgi:DNA-binding transcriptional regulator YiaG
MTAPYHYTECGLDYVWLANGFDMFPGPEGDLISIRDIDGLHRAIGQWLVHERKALTGPELRFLRHELQLSQAALAHLLGVDAQTVARWEKSGRTGRNRPNPAAERTIRLLYLEHIGDEDGISATLKIVADLEDRDAQRITAFEDDGGWALAA